MNDEKLDIDRQSRLSFEYKKRRLIFLGTLAAFISTAYVLFTLISSLSSFNKKAIDARSSDSVTATKTLGDKIEVLDARISKLQRLSLAGSAEGAEGPGKADIQKLGLQLTAVSDRLSRLEVAIGESPERALSIPLLRKDVDELNKKIDEFRAANTLVIDKLYEIQRWIIGGIGSMLVLVFGGVITLLSKLYFKPSKEG